MDENRVNQLVDNFKFGARRECAVEIWSSLLRCMVERNEVRNDTNEAVAERFHISQSVVSRGIAGGNLSLDNLVVILVELGLHFDELQSLPQSKRELAIAGFRLAMAIVYNGGKLDRCVPSPEEVASVACLLATREWWVFVGKNLARKTDPKTKADLLRQVQLAVSQKAQQVFGIESVSRDEVEYQQLVSKWGNPWIECRLAVPYNWIGAL